MDCVVVVDHPWHDPAGDDRPEMLAVRINRAGLVVRAIRLTVSGAPRSLQAAIDEAAARHLSEDAILAEWIDSEPDAAELAGRLLIGLARERGGRPDQSWHGRPIRWIGEVGSAYPPRVERWGNVVDYDSGRSERQDWLGTCESVDEAKALFDRYAQD